MTLLRAATAGLILVLLTPPAAIAQQPDSDSPAGVEYALPLDQARKDARDKRKPSAKAKEGEGGSSAPGEQGEAPLFGAGISKGGDGGGGKSGGGPSASGSTRSGKGESESRGSDSAGGGAEQADSEDGESVAATERASATDDGAGALSPGLVGLVAAVLLLGTAAGLGLRRAFGRSEP